MLQPAHRGGAQLLRQASQTKAGSVWVRILFTVSGGLLRRRTAAQARPQSTVRCVACAAGSASVPPAIPSPWRKLRVYDDGPLLQVDAKSGKLSGKQPAARLTPLSAPS